MQDKTPILKKQFKLSQPMQFFLLAVVCFALPTIARFMLVAESPRRRLIFFILDQSHWIPYVLGGAFLIGGIAEYRSRRRRAARREAASRHATSMPRDLR
jgi:hypothetical protein